MRSILVAVSLLAVIGCASAVEDNGPNITGVQPPDSVAPLPAGNSSSDASAQVVIPTIAQPRAFAFEDKDWGVKPESTPHGPPYGKPTPTSIPGARVVTTLELKSLLDANKEVVVIDVLDRKTRKTIPGAYWMPEAGNSRFYRAEQDRFSAALQRLSGGNKNRAVVFMCLSSECWESYNASLHALEAGYRDVLWYRGGSNAWEGAGLDTASPNGASW